MMFEVFQSTLLVKRKTTMNRSKSEQGFKFGLYRQSCQDAKIECLPLFAKTRSDDDMTVQKIGQRYHHFAKHTQFAIRVALDGSI